MSGSVFTELLLRIGFHNPVVLLLRPCIIYKRLFLWLNRSCMEQIRHNMFDVDENVVCHQLQKITKQAVISNFKILSNEIVSPS
jgi:hypothetical protein